MTDFRKYYEKAGKVAAIDTAMGDSEANFALNPNALGYYLMRCQRKVIEITHPMTLKHGNIWDTINQAIAAEIGGYPNIKALVFMPSVDLTLKVGVFYELP